MLFADAVNSFLSPFKSYILSAGDGQWRKRPATLRLFLLAFVCLSLPGFARATSSSFSESVPQYYSDTGHFSQAGEDTLPLRERRVSATWKGVQLRKALTDICGQVGLKLAYQPGRFNLEQRVSLRLEQVSFRDALAAILEGTGLWVQVTSHQLYLRPVAQTTGASEKADSQRLATQVGAVEGRVYDATTGETLPGANVRIEGAGVGTSADETGDFRLEGIPAGRQTVTVSFVGYEPVSKEIEVEDGTTVRVDFRLDGQAVAAEEVLVTGLRDAQAAALEEQRQAINKVEVVMADDVGKLPDRNLADAISRISGVSVQQGVGDGRYVSIRGLSPALNQVNVNGQTSAISDVAARAGRAGPLDVIGAGEFSSIEVVKTLRPDMDAQGLGGQINVKTPSAFERGRRFAFAQADYGANNANRRDDYSFNAGYGDLFANGDLGVYVGASHSNRSFAFDRIEGGWLALEEDGLAVPVDQELKAVDETRERWSLSSNFEYELGAGSQVYLRSVFNRLGNEGRRDETRNRARGDVELTSPMSGTIGRVRAGELKVRLQDDTRKIFNATLGAESDFGTNGRLLWEPKVTYSYADEARDINYIEADVGEEVPGTFDMSEYIYEINAPARMNENNYNFDKIRFDGGLQDERLYALQSDLTWSADRFRPSGHVGGFKLKGGVKATLRDRTVDEYSNRYGLTDDLNLAPLLKGGPEGFRDRFAFGPTIDADAINDLYDQQPGRFEYLGEDSETNSAEDDYNTEERIYAAYALTEFKTGPLSVLGGLRLEHTDRAIDALQATYINDEYQGLESRSQSNARTDLFPNLQLRLNILDGIVARASFTTSIGRPDFVDLAPISELEAVEETPGVFYGALEEGNPELRPYEAQNYDASLEYYFSPGAILSVSGFYKQVDNPIFERQLELRDVERSGRTFAELDLERTENAESGSVRGVELNYQHQFTFLPGAFSGLGVSTNVAFMDSEVNVFDREDDLPFFTQPDHIYNAQLFYEKAPMQVRLAYQYTGASLLAVGGGPSEDIYESSRTALDAKVTYQLPLSVGGLVFVEAENLTGGDRRRYQGVETRLALDEQFGPVYRAGVAWNL